MDNQDKELRLFNDIMLRLVQLEEQSGNLFSLCRQKRVDKEIEDGLFLCAVWVKDVINKFKKYSEIE